MILVYIYILLVCQVPLLVAPRIWVVSTVYFIGHVLSCHTRLVGYLTSIRLNS